MIKTYGIMHVTISVKDLARATAFYRDVLNCEIVTTNPIMTFMKTGDQIFVLTQLDHHVSPNSPGAPDLDTTLFHHAMLVHPNAYDDILAELKARGISYYLGEFTHTTFPGRKHIYIHDPDGNSIEFATMIPAELHKLDRETVASG